MPKSITLPDFLTPDEIERARKLYCVATPGTFAKRCKVEIIEPVMPRINAALGQENDAAYLAYAVEYVMNQLGAR